MRIPDKTYWLIYTAISSALLLPMLVMGIQNPASLEPLLETGGTIESFPALVYLLSALMSTLLTLRLMKKSKRFWHWGLYSIFCFFLAGEESEWGRESVLGFQGWRTANPDQVEDVHNWLAHLFAQRLSFSIACGTAIAILIIVSLVYLKVPDFKHSLWKCLSKHVIDSSLTHKFVLIGIVLLSFGMVDMLQESFGLPYLPGQWSLEESFELLGSIALLFAIIVRIFEPPHLVVWE